MIDGRDLYLITADPTDMATPSTRSASRPACASSRSSAPESDLSAAIERHYAPDEVAAGRLDRRRSTWPTSSRSSTKTKARWAVPDDELERAAQAAPVIRLVNAILADAIRAGASDIHIEPQQKGVNLRYRVDGALRHVMTMPKRSQAKVVSRIKITAHMDIAERRKPQDGRTRIVLDGAAYDLRVSTLPTADGEKVVIRILAQDRANVAFEELGFEADTLEDVQGAAAASAGI